MKKNRYILILAILLAVVALILVLSTSTTTFKKNVSAFAVNDTSNVVKIFMSDKNNNTLTLTREDSVNWKVNGKYPGSLPNVTMLLKTLFTMEVREPVATAARNNVIREMAGRSVKVEVYQRVYRIDLGKKLRWFPHEKRTKTFYVGDATPNNRGTYMLMEGSSMPYVVYLPGLRGFISPRFMPIEKYWRDYVIFRTQPQAIRSVVVEIPGMPGESYRVDNVRGRITVTGLSDPMPLPAYDTLSVYNFLTGFRNLAYEALLTDMPQHVKDSIRSSQPFVVLTLTDTAGAMQTIKAFHRAAVPGATDLNGNPLKYDIDRLYVLLNNGQDLTLAQFFRFDRILRPKSFFFPDKPSDRK